MNTFQKGDRVWLYGEDRRRHRAIVVDPGHRDIGIQVEGQSVVTTADAEYLFFRTKKGKFFMAAAMNSDHLKELRELNEEEVDE
jgi:hypothetical protein